MSERVQLDHVLIDVDFLHKPTIKALRFKYTDLSALVLIEILAQMSRATDGIIDREVALCVFSDLRFENGEEILEYCISKEILCASPCGGVTNVRVQKDQSACAKKREEAKNRKEAYLQKKREEEERRTKEEQERTRSERVPNAERTVLPVTDTDTVTVTDTVNNNKNSLPKLNHQIPKPIPIPEDLDDEELELWKLSESAYALVKGDEDFLRSQAFITTHRRPLKNYPTVWISQRELFNTFKIWSSKGIPRSQWKEILEKCETKVNSHVRSGKSVDRVNSPDWLQGFLADDAVKANIDILRTEEILARSSRN